MQQYGVDTNEESSFSGEWTSNYRHGRGKMVYASGNVYEGDWVQVRLHRKLDSAIAITRRSCEGHSKREVRSMLDSPNRSSCESAVLGVVVRRKLSRESITCVLSTNRENCYAQIGVGIRHIAYARTMHENSDIST